MGSFREDVSPRTNAVLRRPRRVCGAPLERHKILQNSWPNIPFGRPGAGAGSQLERTPPARAFQPLDRTPEQSRPHGPYQQVEAVSGASVSAGGRDGRNPAEISNNAIHTPAPGNSYTPAATRPPTTCPNVHRRPQRAPQYIPSTAPDARPATVRPCAHHAPRHAPNPRAPGTARTPHPPGARVAGYGVPGWRDAGMAGCRDGGMAGVAGCRDAGSQGRRVAGCRVWADRLRRP